MLWLVVSVHKYKYVMCIMFCFNDILTCANNVIYLPNVEKLCLPILSVSVPISTLIKYTHESSKMKVFGYSFVRFGGFTEPNLERSSSSATRGRIIISMNI